MGAYALIVRFRARPGRSEDVERVLGEVDARLRAADGCELHLVVRAVGEPGEFWVTEVFRDREAHSAAVADPEVRRLAGELRSLLDTTERIEGEPLAR